ncbi:4Fe-4S cluster-binding domain-containing protein [Streptomyces sp. NBC_01142]|uniref:4Fe-4S cluster-binding domain-containing protein n=1 Tax=Streptomyces sp. NBC_01142 TaxID=2975865 RepID=UPI0022563F06|nr:4Fe-4S cluster-binding domain-containing protein [Streptomyces sp. NBC_01142]MCX4821243.1 4Fe-4S cluster-binding domain-containing protein [Streptomyces sp. NBC_01142]
MHEDITTNTTITTDAAAPHGALGILDPLPQPRVLSLLLTLRCTAECGECGTHSSPRVRTRLPEEEAARLIDEAAADSYNLVAFTGGEPMLYGIGLRRLIQRTTDHAMPSRMVSNAFWARTPDKAARALAPLAAAGLGELSVSTGDEHARFVPVERVLHAVRAGIDRGLNCAVMIETRSANRVTRRTLCEHPLFRETFTPREEESITFCESPWMPLDEHEQYSYPDGMTVNSGNLFRRTGCDSVIDTVTVLADGRIMACCGLGTQAIPELQVGHVSTGGVHESRLRAEADFLKRWIRDEGPERILAWAAARDPRIVWEDQYAHRCQACKRLYSDPMVADAVREHYEEKVLDVLTSEWLMHRPLQQSSRGEDAAIDT